MQLEALLERGVDSVFLVIFGCMVDIDRICSPLDVKNRSSGQSSKHRAGL